MAIMQGIPLCPFVRLVGAHYAIRYTKGKVQPLLMTINAGNPLCSFVRFAGAHYAIRYTKVKVQPLSGQNLHFK